MNNQQPRKNPILKHKNKIIAGAAILVVLVLAFLYGGEPPKEESAQPSLSSAQVEKNGKDKKPALPAKISAAPTELPSGMPSETPSDEPSVSPSEATTSVPSDAPESKPEPAPQVTAAPAPPPVAPQDAEVTDKETTCTLSIRCDTAIQSSALSADKRAILPQNGVILSPQKVTFYEGESVFQLLLRETKRNRIHMEFVNTPMYNSAYIEGIANLYEFDCGDLSGWMYKVNGVFPNYGCSQYQLKAGDTVEWVYTCDLGKDVGDNSFSRNGR